MMRVYLQENIKQIGLILLNILLIGSLKITLPKKTLILLALQNKLDR